MSRTGLQRGTSCTSQSPACFLVGVFLAWQPQVASCACSDRQVHSLGCSGGGWQWGVFGLAGPWAGRGCTGWDPQVHSLPSACALPDVLALLQA